MEQKQTKYKQKKIQLKEKGGNVSIFTNINQENGKEDTFFQENNYEY